MEKRCVVCQEAFEAMREHRRYCSQRCRWRAWKTKQREAVMAQGVTPAPIPESPLPEGVIPPAA